MLAKYINISDGDFNFPSVSSDVIFLLTVADDVSGKNKLAETDNKMRIKRMYNGFRGQGGDLNGFN